VNILIDQFRLKNDVMSNVLLVSLLSDQTIPNVQLINQLNNQVDKYLFISTPAMEKKNVRKWIIKACDLPEDKLLDPVVVDQFSFDDIEEKLDSYSFEDFEKVIVNLTGGTKVMTLASFDFFKDLGAEIYYLTGSDDTLIKLSPGRKKRSEKLNTTVNVPQYLFSYGFAITESTPSYIPAAYTHQFFNLYAQGKIESHRMILDILRPFRSKNTLLINNIEGLRPFLDEIEFPLNRKDSLNRFEIKYLTGEWFEEYVSDVLATELNLDHNHLMVGLNISKENREGMRIPNEMDILFTWKNKLYTIECKTSLFNETIQPDGSVKSKAIISETLYKIDSLKQGLGLYVNACLFVLDDLKMHEEKITTHLDRANLFNIKIIDREKLTSGKPLSSYLGI